MRRVHAAAPFDRWRNRPREGLPGAQGSQASHYSCDPRAPVDGVVAPVEAKVRLGGEAPNLLRMTDSNEWEGPGKGAGPNWERLKRLERGRE